MPGAKLRGWEQESETLKSWCSCLAHPGQLPSSLLTLKSHLCGTFWWLGKESAHNAGDAGLIPGLGRSPRDGNGNALQYSCLGVIGHGHRSLVGYSPWGHKESDTTKTYTQTLVGGLPWWSSGKDYTLPMQGTWVQSPVRELRSHILQLRVRTTQLKIWNPATKTLHSKIN